jgi:hypothetical protein
MCYYVGKDDQRYRMGKLIGRSMVGVGNVGVGRCKGILLKTQATRAATSGYRAAYSFTDVSRGE